MHCAKTTSERQNVWTTATEGSEDRNEGSLFPPAFEWAAACWGLDRKLGADHLRRLLLLCFSSHSAASRGVEKARAACQPHLYALCMGAFSVLLHRGGNSLCWWSLIWHSCSSSSSSAKPHWAGEHAGIVLNVLFLKDLKCYEGMGRWMWRRR